MAKVVESLLRRPRRLSSEEYMAKMLEKGLDEHGNFVVDATPLAPPIGYKKQPSMVELVREMVRSERLKAEAEANGHESFEEAEDFDIEDDPDMMRSPWENDFDPPLREILREGQQEIDRKERDKNAQALLRRKKAQETPTEAAEADENEGVQGD